MNDDVGFGLFFGAFLGLLFGSLGGAYITQESIRTEAISVGVATYLDGHESPKFHWYSPKVYDFKDGVRTVREQK